MFHRLRHLQETAQLFAPDSSPHQGTGSYSTRSPTLYLVHAAVRATTVIFSGQGISYWMTSSSDRLLGSSYPAAAHFTCAQHCNTGNTSMRVVENDVFEEEEENQKIKYRICCVFILDFQTPTGGVRDLQSSVYAHTFNTALYFTLLHVLQPFDQLYNRPVAKTGDLFQNKSCRSFVLGPVRQILKSIMLQPCA